jgi:cyclophilin family peptidyl-prolyl cis-trans isomerase
MDDGNPMRGTLSQPSRRSDRSRRGSNRSASAHVALWLVGLAWLSSIAGCDGSGKREAAEPGQAATAQPGGAAKTTVREPFSWPEDPSHPVLAIDVNGPEIEGRILIELMPELAPSSVVGLIELAASGFYDGTTFHRVIPDFMIQGGDPNSRDRDPTNDGAGPSGRTLPDEFSEAPFMRGVVGMGNRGRPGSTSTQIFIMQADKRGLNGRYNAVGRVIDGLDVVDAVAAVTTDRSGRWGPQDRPIVNVVLQRVRPIGQIGQIRE